MIWEKAKWGCYHVQYSKMGMKNEFLKSFSLERTMGCPYIRFLEGPCADASTPMPHVRLRKVFSKKKFQFFFTLKVLHIYQHLKFSYFQIDTSNYSSVCMHLFRDQCMEEYSLLTQINSKTRKNSLHIPTGKRGD